MRTMSLLTVGFLSMMAATAALDVPNSFAADAKRADFIETFSKTLAQLDSSRTSDGEAIRVDVIDKLKFDGPTYPYVQPMNR